MKKNIILSFFLLFIASCYNKPNLQNIIDSNKIKLIPHSKNGVYLSSSYSILIGDVFSANRLLKFETKDNTLLELKFFS